MALIHESPDRYVIGLVEGRFSGWRVNRHSDDRATRDGIPIPAGHYAASHVIWEVPCIVAPSLDEIAEALTAAEEAQKSKAEAKRSRWRGNR